MSVVPLPFSRELHLHADRYHESLCWSSIQGPIIQFAAAAENSLLTLPPYLCGTISPLVLRVTMH